MKVKVVDENTTSTFGIVKRVPIIKKRAKELFIVERKSLFDDVRLPFTLLMSN